MPALPFFERHCKVIREVNRASSGCGAASRVFRSP
jgi:hypothetical protein